MRGMRELRIDGCTDELMRGLRMASGKRSVSMRGYVTATLYEALDRELADWPEWRYQTKPGDEKTLFQDGRKAAGLKRRKKKPVDPEDV